MQDADRAGGLRHALDEQDPRHDRLAGEMAGEIRFVDRDILDADRGVVAVDIDDPVDHQKRKAMRQQFVDCLDVEADKRGRVIRHLDYP